MYVFNKKKFKIHKVNTDRNETSNFKRYSSVKTFKTCDWNFLKQAFMNGWFFVLKNIFFIWSVKPLPHKLKLLVKSDCTVLNFLRKLGKSRKQNPWRLGSHLYRKQHDNSRKNISCRFVQRKGEKEKETWIQNWFSKLQATWS